MLPVHEFGVQASRVTPITGKRDGEHKEATLNASPRVTLCGMCIGASSLPVLIDSVEAMSVIPLTSNMPAGLPANVRQVLADFLSSAQKSFADDLLSAVLFGSAAEGALRKSSDVNLILVLRRYHPDRAERLRSALGAAEAAILLRVMFLVQDEIPAACEAFAQKFSDIVRRRVALLGSDPFAGLSIPRTAQVRRLRQVSLNLLLRLREIHSGQDSGSRSALHMLADSTGALRSSAVLLLLLETGNAPKPKPALIQVAEQVAPGKFTAAMAKLSQLRETNTLSRPDAHEVMIAMMELTAAIHARAAALRE